MVGSVYEVRANQRVPGLVRRKTAVSRHEPRRQEQSGRSRSISRPTPRQPPQSQHHGPQLRHPSLRLASPYDDRYASEDDSTSEELPESPYVSAPDESRGRRRNPVGASSAAPLPPRYCPPTVSTLSTDSGHGQGGKRDGDGGRDHRGATPESLLRDPEWASHGRRSSHRGVVGSDAGFQQDRHPRSPQTFDLPLGRQPPPAQPTTAAPTPPPNSRNPRSSTAPHHYQEYPESGMAPPRHAHAHANNTVPGLQHREGIARAGYAGRVATDPPSPPRPSPSHRRQNREPSRSRAAPAPPLVSRNPASSNRNGAYASLNGRSGLEREGKQERERAGGDEKDRRADRLEAERLTAEMEFEQAYQASMADRRRSIRRAGNYEVAGEEGLSTAMPKSNPDPVAHPLPHTSGIPSHQQAPPPPPLHTRPRSFLPQQRRPAYPAAAPPPPPSSAAPRPQIDRGIPTAINARDSLFGFSNQEERDDGGEDRGDRRADVHESASRNPYLDQAGSRQGSLKEDHYKRAGEKGLSSANAHPQLSSGQRRRPPAPPSPNLPSRSNSRSCPSRGMSQQQQRQRPAHPAASYPPSAAAAGPASDRSDSSSFSSSAVPGPRNPAATSRGNPNANANASSTGPRGARVGAVNTGPGPRTAPSPRREGAGSVGGYGSVRKGAELPGPSSIKTGERATPPQQRRPAHPATAAPPAPPAPPAPGPRNPRPSSSIASRPRNPHHVNETNPAPRAGAVGARSAGFGPRTAPGSRREGVRSVSVSGRSNFRKPSSPDRSTSSRWGEKPRSAGHQRAANKAQKNGKRRQEEPKPTLTQKIGYKLWVTALGCM